MIVNVATEERAVLIDEFEFVLANILPGHRVYFSWKIEPFLVGLHQILFGRLRELLKLSLVVFDDSAQLLPLLLQGINLSDVVTIFFAFFTWGIDSTQRLQVELLQRAYFFGIIAVLAVISAVFKIASVKLDQFVTCLRQPILCEYMGQGPVLLRFLDKWQCKKGQVLACSRHLWSFRVQIFFKSLDTRSINGGLLFEEGMNVVNTEVDI